jgi:hypothetical protein
MRGEQRRVDGVVEHDEVTPLGAQELDLWHAASLARGEGRGRAAALGRG